MFVEKIFEIHQNLFVFVLTQSKADLLLLGELYLLI
jgi:hypothetical protein